MLRPGGFALLTTHGEEEFEAYRSGRVVSNTPSCTQSRWTSKDFPGTDSTFGLAFHSEGYIREEWAKRFEILVIVPRVVGSRQDIVVAQTPRT